MMRSIEKVDFAGKKVLVRVDFNVEMNNIGEVEEHFRFDIAKKTVDHILSFPGAKVALLTHFGRPDGKPVPEYSTGRLVPAAERALGRKLTFVDDCVGDKVIAALASLEEGSAILLENVRFYAEEERDDMVFAERLARPFDLYVNDAFSVCHRAHASVSAVTKRLPSCAGYRVLEEASRLDDVRFSPEHPAIAVIGGAKIETKLPLIHALESEYDCILVGGKIANEAIDQKIEFSEKVLLPKDFDSDQRLDIGPNTIAYYTQIIKTAKTIVWNGPMGKFEEKPYDIGTGAILEAMIESQAFVVIGGGESLAVIEHAGVYDKIGFVSSGGGAMLEYMGGKELPGLKALEF
jgi:3-phosphoglycerate kinase